MDYNSELHLVVVCLVLDEVFALVYGFDPTIHSFLVFSAKCLVLCALTGHALEWFCRLSDGWEKILNSFFAISPRQQCAVRHLCCQFLWHIYLPYEMFKRLRDFRNIPNHPCLCRRKLPDGTRPLLKDCCWKEF